MTKHGLKSIAQDLAQYGRNGDTIIAHINPQEAAMLKAAGGSGTVNPHTGLLEFGMFGIGGGGGFLGTGINKNASDPVSKGISQVTAPISKAFQGAAGAVDQGLVGLDKAVGKAIPGGWSTVGMAAASMMGVPAPIMGGLGALSGSGVLRKGGSFNMQGALMGGAMAYGMASLGEYARAAVPGGIEGVTPPPTVDAAGNLVNAATGEVGSGLAGNASGMLVDPSAVTSANTGALNALSAPMEAGAGIGLQAAPPPSIGSQIMSGNFGDAFSQAGQNISQGVSNLGTSAQEGLANLGTKASNLYDTATTPSTYTEALDKGVSNIGKTTEGIKNLLGAGEMTASEASKLAGVTSGVSPAAAGTAIVYGGTGLAALEEQRKALADQLASNAISDQEYNTALAEINRSEAIARNAVAANPFNTNPDRSATIGGTSYARNTPNENLYGRSATNLYDELAPRYAYGGSIDGEAGGDDNYSMGGNIPGYAAGGQTHFLSGGGDGMSDSIPATIEGTQEARLADGEFVIPADVVSHLGNGSSKAGAKQLYSMMDKVRKARTGTKKQGKEINPNKYLAV